MSRTLIKLTVYTAVFGFVTPAWAADVDLSGGLYAGAAIGVVDGTDTTASGANGGSVKFDNDIMGAVFIGTQLNDNLRGEAELSRRNLDLSTVGGATATGDAQATSLMGNVVYDIDVDAQVRPYVGAGAGFAKVNFDNASPFGGSTINDSDTVGAVQAIAGASYPLDAQVDLFADYRYFTTADASFTTAAGGTTSMDISTHSVMAGLRFSFGGGSQSVTNTDLSGTSSMNDGSGRDHAAQAQPASEPIAEVAALPTRTLPETYLVHFVLNKADVTPEGIAIIEQAAANAKTMNVTRLVLTGHTDRAGEESYNLSLSKRRAEAVRMAFVALGFNEDEITIKAKGETNLLVPTSDGKHEPQNRRVEIVLP